MMTKINPSTGSHPQPEGRFKVLHRAINSAVVWHAGQDRKYSEVPYIVHPLRVMSLVRSVTDDEDMLVAAVFHDVIEDTRIEKDTIQCYYGDRVADLVDWLSDVSKPEDGNRATRKAIDLEHTANAPPEAQTIKLADLIDNTRSITCADPDFARVYMKEKERLLEVLHKGDKALYAEAKNLLVEYQTGLLQESLKHG